MARSQRRTHILDPGEDRVHETDSSTRRAPLAVVTAFFAICLVLNSLLTSTPSASSNPTSTVSDNIRAIFRLFDPYYVPLEPGSPNAQSWTSNSGTRCPFPLPQVLTHDPIHPDRVDPPVQTALASLDRYLQDRTSLPDVDSLAIAVVTPSGTIFERGYGVLRANESFDSTDRGGKEHQEGRYPVNGASIYRIASVSKMFAVFEALLLRERGVLELDDPVQKYIPEFRPPSKEWPEYLRDRGSLKSSRRRDPKRSRITLRQLASHTSGLGRDYPVTRLPKWPTSKLEAPVSDERNSTWENVLGGINEYPLVNPPHAYPIYSNVGFDMLGLALVAAAKWKAGNDGSAEERGGGLRGKEEGPKTYKGLVKRDIFEPFGLTSSFFRVPDDEWLRNHIAVPSKYPQWANVVLGDVDDSAGGQYSSLGDLAKMAQVFLSATAPSEEFDFLPDVVKEWLRPVHIWANGGEAVGAPWEISYLPPGTPSKRSLHKGRAEEQHRFTGNIPIYSKSGNMPGYHSMFSLNPQFGYAVVVLVTGTYSKTETFVGEALKRLQPAVEGVSLERVREKYIGRWDASDGEQRGHADVKLVGGQLVLTALVVDGVDVLGTLLGFTYELQPPLEGLTGDSASHGPMALWSTGRKDEFRMAMGRGSPADDGHDGTRNMYECSAYWATIDFGAFARGASVDLVYWEEGELVYPSAGVRFRRGKGDE